MYVNIRATATAKEKETTRLAGFSTLYPIHVQRCTFAVSSNTHDRPARQLTTATYSHISVPHHFSPYSRLANISMRSVEHSQRASFLLLSPFVYSLDLFWSSTSRSAAFASHRILWHPKAHQIRSGAGEKSLPGASIQNRDNHALLYNQSIGMVVYVWRRGER